MKSIEIIAEIANAHQGSTKLAYKIAEEVVKAGAESIKFQIYFADELLVKDHTRFLHFKKQSFSEEEWINLIKKSKDLGVKIYCDIFGEKALKLANSLDVDGFKIHSSDLNNRYLLNLISDIKPAKKIILSCGGSNIREINYALNILRNHKNLTLMHGFQSYPTSVSDSNLRRLDWLKYNFGDLCKIGYQDHVAGEDFFAYTLPLLAIFKGAEVIEKHITLDRSEKGVDYYSSLEPKEFKKFIGYVKQTLSALGEQEFYFSKDEIKYRNVVKKRIVSVRELKEGHVISESDLTFKRTEKDSIDSTNIDNFIGKKLIKKIPKEYSLSRNDIAVNAWGLIIARTNSKRLNNKAILEICGKPSIVHLFERVKRSKKVSQLILCTTINKEDDILVNLAKENEIKFYRGDTKDVLGRMLGAIEGCDPDIILRITGDDILIDPEYMDLAIEDHLKKNVEYTDSKSLPSGTEVEVFNTNLLRQIYACTNDKNDTEYLTYYISQNKDHISTNSLIINPKHKNDWRLTLDNQEDFEVISMFLKEMNDKGILSSYKMDDMVEFFNKNPQILEINKLIRTKKQALDVNTNMNWKNLRNNI